MMHESLPQKLRVLRAQKGWTLTEAARRVGVGRDTLSDLERGRQHPVMPTLSKIARGYGVPIEGLLIEEQPVLAGKGEAPGEAGPFSIEWARTASDAEFYRLIVMAPEEDTDRLDKLSGKLTRFVRRPVKRILTERNNKTFEDQGPEPNRDEYERMKERSDALYAEVNRRRPPFAIISWRREGPAEVRWLIPEDEREALRPEIEETLKGEDYIEIGPGDPATADVPPERSMALTRSAA